MRAAWFLPLVALLAWLSFGFVSQWYTERSIAEEKQRSTICQAARVLLYRTRTQGGDERAAEAVVARYCDE